VPCLVRRCCGLAAFRVFLLSCSLRSVRRRNKRNESKGASALIIEKPSDRFAGSGYKSGYIFEFGFVFSNNLNILVVFRA
jgi:hypothetical protein